MQLDPTKTVAEVGEKTAETLRDSGVKAKNAILESFADVGAQIVDLLPKIVTAIIVLAIGYVVARLVARACTALAEKLGLQRAAERGGMAQSMKQAGVERTVPQIVGVFVFWLLMCVFLFASLDILNLPGVANAVQNVFAYIPKLLVATVLVVVGLLLSSLLRGVIATSADRVGITYAPQLASACYYILALMTFIAAFEQLEIKFELLNYAILIAFGAFALAVGLSCGLGGREVMAGILSGYYLRQRLQAGDLVQIGQFEGTVRDVGPVATIIETKEDGLLHRHSIPNSKMLSDAVR